MSTTNIRLKRSSVKGKSPTTGNLQLGEIAINTNDGRIFFKTTDSASSSAIVTLREISAGTGITETAGEISITNTGVVSATYGSSTEIPVLSINAQGQIDSATTVSIAGVSGLAYDSDTNLLTLSTGDGGSYSVKLNLQTFSDSDTTDDLNEGVANLYYTSGRADSDAKNAISVTDAGGDGSLSYNSTTGVLTYTGPSASEVRAHFSAGEGIDLTSGVISGEDATISNKGIASFDSNEFSVTAGAVNIKANGINDTHIDFGTSTNQVNTGDIPEQTNLYYTKVRVDSDFDARLATKSTSDLSEGSNLYYTTARADS